MGFLTIIYGFLGAVFVFFEAFTGGKLQRAMEGIVTFLGGHDVVI